MRLQALIERYSDRLAQRYGQALLPSHRKALDAILACRRQCGTFYAHCEPCHSHACVPLSCGHRSCPQCQHHLGTAWLERQQDKLLPVTYFMVTFTLPAELRGVAWQHQSVMYELLFKAAQQTLLTIGRNNHGLELGMAAVFRGIFLSLLFEQALPLPSGLPKQWVADVRTIGRGDKALRYLSNYLYRGVISENDIMVDRNGKVTFRYRESKTRQMRSQTVPAETFLWKLLTHVLPRGFRRVRDYGFLHGNARVKLKRIQLLLRVRLKPKAVKPKGMRCRECAQPMQIDLVVPQSIPLCFRSNPITFAHEPMS